jgi:aryl-alcohol dehydrogenase-like predicted oxidoreductase
MTYGHLGRSGLSVSRISLGTMNFGCTVDESSSFDVMDAAIDEGVNFSTPPTSNGGPQSPDTAQGYGVAEETVGRWLQRSGRRDDIVPATKVSDYVHGELVALSRRPTIDDVMGEFGEAQAADPSRDIDLESVLAAARYARGLD